MNEEERAEWLARAIDGLIRGEPAPQLPAGLQDEDLESLLRIAHARLRSGREAGQDGLAYEGDVWQELLGRFEATVGKRQQRSPAPAPQEPTSLGDESGLKDVMVLRWRMAEEMATYSERYREDVWRDVQSRIQDRASAAGILSIFDRLGKKALRLAPAAGRSGANPRLEDLLAPTAANRRLAPAGQAAADAADSALWERVESGMARRSLDAGASDSGRGRFFWPRVAAVGAAAALVIAALGPVPATGFADSPAGFVTDLVASHLGLTETTVTPAITPVEQTVQGKQTTIAEARQLTGLPVTEPSALPSGFKMLASRYFPVALTADSGGMFVLTYQNTQGDTLAIYQETAAGADLASFRGSAMDLMLAGSIPATYFDGAWTSADGTLRWSEGGTQSLLFDSAGTRAILQYKGARMDPVLLVNIAEGMLSPTATAPQ